MAKKILRHGDLEVYQKAFNGAMEIFELSQSFPKEETYSLTDQIRRSSRSVCANIAEAWRKRRYEKSFISTLSDAEGEATETQVWLSFAARCGYMPREVALNLYDMVSQDGFVLYSLGPVAGFARHDHGFLFLCLAASPPNKERETMFRAAGPTVHCKVTTNLVYRTYDEILRMIVAMIIQSDQWIIVSKAKSIAEETTEYNDDPF